MIRLDGLTKRFPNGQLAVDHVNLEIATGEICMLVGPSGCGKTTTLKMINRLIEPTSGRILLDDEDVTGIDPVGLRLRMGYVIQQVGLFPHLTIRDNVATVPRLMGWKRDRIRARVDELLALVGLEPARFAGRYPYQLSGGQQQRVGVARALAIDPPVLLMDEPFGAIDRITRDRLQNEFLRIQREVRKTIVFVTHDIDEAIRLGDRIAVFREGGILEQYDAPATLLYAPRTPFVAEFLGPERGLKRLQVVTIERGDLDSAGRVPAADALARRTVELGASLSDALSAMVLNGTGWAAVLEGGAPVGLFTEQALQRALLRPAPGFQDHAEA